MGQVPSLQHKARLRGREICHYSDARQTITSHHRTIFIRRAEHEQRITLPRDGWGLAGRFRLARRALRLDKCNVVPTGPDLENLVILHRGQVFHFDAAAGTLTQTLTLRNCRNILHQAICVVDGDTVYFGEYGQNPERQEVPVYRSTDGGRTWRTIFTFPAGRIKHVHGCYWDPFAKEVWVLTGDRDGECYMLVADPDFTNVRWLGDGTQTWRACNVFFERDRIAWIMDSQYEDSRAIVLDRASREIRKLDAFPGPVWYIKRLLDGYYLAATAVEFGAGVKDDYSHLMLSRDLETWSEIHRYRHDGLSKRYFKFGILTFADGPQTSDSFYLFGEALKGMDGRVYECSLTA